MQIQSVSISWFGAATGFFYNNTSSLPGWRMLTLCQGPLWSFSNARGTALSVLFQLSGMSIGFLRSRANASRRGPFSAEAYVARLHCIKNIMLSIYCLYYALNSVSGFGYRAAQSILSGRCEDCFVYCPCFCFK